MILYKYTQQRTLMKEIYKDIEGYEGIYKISNTGKVYSVKNGIVLKTVKRKASKTEYEFS